MDTVVKDVRAVLVADGTLTATVAAAQITSAYVAETAEYPCIRILTNDGSAVTGLSGIRNQTLEITTYSDVNAKQAYDIYDLVEGLLHNQEQNLTSADRLFHLIFETSVKDSYDAANDVWIATATYQILYSTSGVVVTSGADGVIYADASDVTAVAGKKIANFRGGLVLDLGFGIVEQTEQERFAKSFYTNRGTVIIRLAEVIFTEAALNLYYGITSNASDTLANGSTAATSRTIDQSIVPQALQFLFQMTRTDDGKLFEVEADRAICPSMQIAFSRSDLSVYNAEWFCFGDGSDKVVKFSTEN